MGGDVVLSGEVCNGPGYFKDPVIGAGAEPQAFNGTFQELLPFPLQGAKLLDVPGLHEGIGIDGFLGEPLPLDLPGLDDPVPDGGRAFHGLSGLKVLVAHGRDLDVQVDAIQNGS